MILSLVDFIVRDFVYKQNPDTSYVIKNEKFVLEDRNGIIDIILKTLEQIYTNIVTHYRLNPGRIECNVYLLDQALTRYSRDLFGETRLANKINQLKTLGRITDSQKEWLSEFSDYGFKIDSCRPYFHRQLSVLLYWLAALKPFAIYPEDDCSPKELGVAFEFHNEYISYLLCLVFLKVFNITLTIHRNRDIFYDFLYDLHFRRMSRSSLEFFLGKYMERITT
jgi:hypothetical protein